VGECSRAPWQLRPVTFLATRTIRKVSANTGLIAEEVAKVYPELLIRGERGEIESVQYRELIPPMLNEMQHQQAALAELKTQNHDQQAELTELKTQNRLLRVALSEQNATFMARLERLERASHARTLASR
jgi:hypothetical protein